MTGPDFLKVLTADIARVGADGACVLALIRYMTALDSERNGRMRVDGQMWWQASHAVIGELVGMSQHDKIRRILVKLTDAGELESLLVGSNRGGRLVAYRLPADQPLRESASNLTSHYADSRPMEAEKVRMDADSRSNGRISASSLDADMRNGPIYKELTKEHEELGDARASVTTPAVPDSDPPVSLHQILLNPNPPPGYCKFHPGGTAKPCKGCAFAVELLQDWYRFNKPSGTDLKLMSLYGRPFTDEDACRLFGKNIDGEVINDPDEARRTQ